MQQIAAITAELDSLAKEAAAAASSPVQALATFSPAFNQLVHQFPDEYAAYQLDEVLVATIAPIVSVYLLWQTLLTINLDAVGLD